MAKHSTPIIDQINNILEHHQHAQVAWVDKDGKKRTTRVDATTASVYKQVWEKLSESNRALLASKTFPVQIDIMWKVVRKR